MLTDAKPCMYVCVKNWSAQCMFGTNGQVNRLINKMYKTFLHVHVQPHIQAFQFGGGGKEERLVHTVVCRHLILKQLLRNTHKMTIFQ